MRLNGVKWNHFAAVSVKTAQMTLVREWWKSPDIVKFCPFPSGFRSCVGTEISTEDSFQPSCFRSALCSSATSSDLSKCFIWVRALKPSKWWRSKSSDWITSWTRWVTSASDFCLLPVIIHVMRRQMPMFSRARGELEGVTGCWELHLTCHWVDPQAWH